jgi:hypothetical protein
MAEALNIIFQNFWNFCGTIIIIFSIGNALSMPFYWYYKLKQYKLNKSVWGHQ